MYGIAVFCRPHGMAESVEDSVDIQTKIIDGRRVASVADRYFVVMLSIASIKGHTLLFFCFVLWHIRSQRRRNLGLFKSIVLQKRLQWVIKSSCSQS